MENFKVDTAKKWEYENGFYLTCEKNRIGKFLNQLDLYKEILNVPGDILEFGVYKGSSIMRLITFRDLLEPNSSRKIIGFDAFGKFPKNLMLKSDREFAEKFEKEGGFGISKKELNLHLENKNATNYELVQGDIMESLPDYVQKHPDLEISLLHIDVDVYEPTKVILENLWDNIVPGGVLMLDDYGIIEGETKAVDEYFSNQNITINKPMHHQNPSYIIK